MEKQKALEEEFTRELVANALAAQELGCRTQRLIQDAQRRGGAEAVRAMLARRQATPDAHLLARAGRLELSCEALVTRGKYSPLFTDQEADACLAFLCEAGYYG